MIRHLIPVRKAIAMDLIDSPAKTDPADRSGKHPDTKKAGNTAFSASKTKKWHPQWDSNPCYQDENLMS